MKWWAGAPIAGVCGDGQNRKSYISTKKILYFFTNAFYNLNKYDKRYLHKYLVCFNIWNEMLPLQENAVMAKIGKSRHQSIWPAYFSTSSSILNKYISKFVQIQSGIWTNTIWYLNKWQKSVKVGISQFGWPTSQQFAFDHYLDNL